jgi:uncharacterized protein YndB with AHSA1/START domain
MSDNPSDIVITRRLAAPRARIWKAWSDPALLAQWWCPKPWTTEVRAFEFRPGGDFYTFMRGPNAGEESDNPGAFLEIVPQQRIVFTSMLIGGWRPATPWMPMTAVFEMSDDGDGTRYHVTCMHATPGDAQKHIDMGFHEGWNICISQLEEFAGGL